APHGDAPDAAIDGKPGAHTHAVVAAGNFVSTGLLSVLDVEAHTVATDVAPSKVGNDPVLRRFGDELFVLNRDKGTVTILSALDYSFVEELDTGGTASNPQDVAV